MKLIIFILLMMISANAYADRVRVKLRPLKGVIRNSPCRHIAIEDFNTGKLLAYTHEDEIFTDPSIENDPNLIRNIKETTSKLITKTVAEAKLAVDGKEYDR